MEVFEKPIIDLEYDTYFGRSMSDIFGYIFVIGMAFISGFFLLIGGILQAEIKYILGSLIFIVGGLLMIPSTVSYWPYKHCKLMMYSDFFELSIKPSSFFSKKSTKCYYSEIRRFDDKRSNHYITIWPQRWASRIDISLKGIKDSDIEKIMNLLRSKINTKPPDAL